MKPGWLTSHHGWHAEFPRVLDAGDVDVAAEPVDRAGAGVEPGDVAVVGGVAAGKPDDLGCREEELILLGIADHGDTALTLPADAHCDDEHRGAEDDHHRDPQIRGQLLLHCVAPWLVYEGRAATPCRVLEDPLEPTHSTRLLEKFDTVQGECMDVMPFASLLRPRNSPSLPCLSRPDYLERSVAASGRTLALERYAADSIGRLRADPNCS